MSATGGLEWLGNRWSGTCGYRRWSAATARARTFHRLWNIGFRPADLARASDDDADLNDESDDGFDEQEIPA
jgi:hypothetical protein